MPVAAHSGRTNAAGCHAGQVPYHCHRGGDSGAAARAAVTEDSYNQLFCASVGGRTEVRHDYDYPGGRGYVKVDCETATRVWEGGLDKRSSLDSVQQALFFHTLTGKTPGVVIYDTDGQIGKYEYRIKSACVRAGVKYRSYP